MGRVPVVTDANSRWPGWFREPLVHFVLIGAAVFAVYAILRDPQPTYPLTADDAPIAQLRRDWNARKGAPPNAAEEQRLKDDWLEEEVLYQRALELGLDESDTIIRRRLVQRMRFLIEDTTPVPEPGDLQLRAWIDAHPDRYEEAARISLDHVFFSRVKRGSNLNIDAGRAAATLAAAPEATVSGDPFPRGNHLDRYTPTSLARSFGVAFARRVGELPVGNWHGPFESSYGLHVVRVTRRTEAAPPSLEGARKRARADWIYERRRQLNREAVESMIGRYAGQEDPRR